MVATAPTIARGAVYFLSGVMQGSSTASDASRIEVKGVSVVSQDYRALMKEAILKADSSAKVLEPWDLVGKVVKDMYGPDVPKEEYFKADKDVATTFQHCVDQAAMSDVVVSYLPEASMGSAVEIHAARLQGKRIIAIAPGRMAGNWVVRSYSDNKIDTIDELPDLIASLLDPA